MYLLEALGQGLDLVLLALGEALALAAGGEPRNVSLGSVHGAKSQCSSERSGSDNLADLDGCLLLSRARRCTGHLDGLASHWNSAKRLHGALEGQLMLGSLHIKSELRGCESLPRTGIGVRLLQCQGMGSIPIK